MAISNTKKKAAGVAGLLIGTLALVGAGTGAIFTTQADANVGFTTGVMNQGLTLTGDSSWTSNTGSVTKSLGTNAGSYVETYDTLTLRNTSTMPINTTLKLERTGLADKMQIDVSVDGVWIDSKKLASAQGAALSDYLAPGSEHVVVVNAVGVFDNGDDGKSGSYTLSVDGMA